MNKLLLLIVVLSASVSFANERTFEFRIAENNRREALSTKCIEGGTDEASLRANCFYDPCDLLKRAKVNEERVLAYAKDRANEALSSCEDSGAVVAYHDFLTEVPVVQATIDWLFDTKQVEYKGSDVVSAGCDKNAEVQAAQSDLEAQQILSDARFTKIRVLRTVFECEQN